MSHLSQIIKFVRLLNKFRGVKRAVWVNNEDRLENDVEHSYQLGMLAWYISNLKKSNLDIDLLLKYALVHDFVEIYAGDTDLFSKNKKHKENKPKREKRASLLLKKNFPDFKVLHRLIERYEKRKDKESRFIYALDKIQPLLNIYTDGGRTWKNKGITLKMLIDHKKDKVALSAEIKKYFNELINLLKKEEKRLFRNLPGGRVL